MSGDQWTAEELQKMRDSLANPFDPCEKLKSAIARTSENEMKGYDEWKGTDSEGERREAESEALAQRIAAIIADPSKLEAADADACLGMDDGIVFAMFTLLADANDSGLIDRLACGDPIHVLPVRLQDVFARLARAANQIGLMRAKAVSDAAEDEGDD